MRALALSTACALLGALVLVPAASAAAEAPAPPTPAPAYVPHRVIVEWAPGANRPDKVGARENAEVEYQANLGNPAFQLVEVEPGQTVAAAIEELRGEPAVVVAERDSYAAPASIPDDPLYGQEWGLENTGLGVDGFSGATAGADIDAPAAWAHTVGTPSTVIADIDSGYRFNSPDLGPVAWENPGEIAGNGIDDDGNGYVDDVHGYDFVGPDSESPSEDADPTDDDLVSGGHGVHTAGTIGAAGNNGVGITGVAQNVRIMPLRVCANAPALNELRCPTSSLIAAINYAGANGARAANISLSGMTKSTAELDAFAENPQTLFVIAADNDAENNDSVGHYPCDYEPQGTGIGGAIDNIVCVAATDQADQLASFSDWGHHSVDLGAPGTEILSTYPAIEDLLGEGFEQEDFATKWTPGAGGGFERTNEAPLTSFGISDSPGATPVAGSVRESVMSAGVSVPSGYGACQFSGRRFVSLGGGGFNQAVFANGVLAFNSNPANTVGSSMANFLTAPITGLAGTTVKIRFRYTAGSSPSASSGVWLDDLELSCYTPTSVPPVYEYLQGTSMATPQVTGTAALLFSLRPSASVTEARDALLSSVDLDPSLAAKTVSGGRLDAAKAMDAIEEPPPPPSLNSTDPASPANWNEPRIVGEAEAGTTVKIYSGASCVGSPVATGSAAALESPGIAVQVADDSISQFSATATDAALNESTCSGEISYTEKSTPPAAPSLNSTDPASPANENHPRIVGTTVESQLEIQVYSGASCGGSPIASGTASELDSPGIAVEVADDSVSQFSATATDQVNTSACSAPISYTEDSTPPPAPSLNSTDPASPANWIEPRIVGSAVAGSSVRVYAGASCEGSPVASGTASELDSPGIAVLVAESSVSQFSATATDAALNESGCSNSISYSETATIGLPSVIFIPPPLATPPPAERACIVPKLAGDALAKAKAALSAAGCTLGAVTKPRAKRGHGLPPLTVKSSTPAAGASTAGAVALKLAPKPKKHHH